MKRICFFLMFLSLYALINAKSDIQITSPLVSFFNKYEVESEGVKKNNDALFKMSNSVVRIMNYNYLWNNKFGFFETVSLVDTTIIPADPDGSLSGLQISLGPSLILFDANSIYVTASTGPSIQFFSNGIVLGIESDFQLKFTANRRCSPVIGSSVNLDFYSTQKAVTYVDKYRTIKYPNSNYTYSEHYKEPVEYSINKYLNFYVRPYIAFCINLY